jgi:CBS-domain-containing membrane protein
MAVTTGPLLALTASDLMSRDVVTISQDAPLGAAVELFFRRQIDEAAVVDSEGRCVGALSASGLLCWGLGEAPGVAEDVPPACRYQVKGRLLTGEDGVICTLGEGSCPLQEVRPMKGGCHTAVCLLQGGPVSGGRAPAAVRRYVTADSTVGAEAPLAALARAVSEGHAHCLIVVDEQHRPVGIVSGLDVLAALARGLHPAAGG